MTSSSISPPCAHRGFPATAVVLGLMVASCGSSSSDPTPTITSPGGGSVIGGQRSIRWSGFGSDATVDIQVSDDGGSTFTLLADNTANDGGYSWDTTANADDNDYQLRVSGEKGSDRSGIFSVDNTAPTIALTAPNGGELVGAAGTITWVTTDANPGTVEILASADGGANYDITVANEAPDSGTYSWDASALADGTTYRVQVLATDRAGNESVLDASDADFELDATIPVVTLMAPNGGETFTATQNITWSTVETNPGTVEITLSDDGGATYGEVISMDAADTGAFPWESGRVEDSALYRVQIVAVDAAGNRSSADASDGNFTTRNVRLEGPAHYRDTNGSGRIDAGDELYLRYAEPIVVAMTADAADFELPKMGDSLGTGATVAAGAENFTIVLTLGANPVLRTRGVYDPLQNDDISDSSGIDMGPSVTANSIESAADGTDVSSVGPVEITCQPAALTATGSELVEARRGDVGDLDGDGILDLVIAVTGADASQRWTGIGDGTFATAQSFDTSDARDVALGDIDQDGDLDVVLAVAGPNTVWINDGSGALSDSTQVLGTATSQGVELFDVDGDGDLDALFANLLNAGNRVWLNDGSGVFSNSGIALGNSNTQAIVSADFDADGDLDFFAANDGSNSRIWLNTGSGNFNGTAIPVTSTDARDVKAADLDGDGDIDVFMSALGQKQFLRNDGSGEFPDGPVFYGNNDNRAIALFDIDGDGDLDVVAAKHMDSGRYWINDGNAVFTEDEVDLLPGAANDVVVGQFDDDSDLDLLVINDGGAHQPYLGSVSGGQLLATYTATARSEGPWQSADASCGDVNGDGSMDLLVPDVLGAVNVLLGDGAGDFTEGTAFGGTDTRSGDLVDVDGDGDLDYIQRIGAVGTITDSLFLNNGSGVFTDSGLTLGLDTYSVGDMTGDGDADLVVFSGTMVETWAGDGNGAFSPVGSPLNLVTAHGIAGFLDFDSDGDMDVLSSNTTTVRILENDGAGILTQNSGVAFPDTGAIAVGDLDGDGHQDLVLGSTSGANLAWAEFDPLFGFTGVTTALAVPNVMNDIRLVDRNEDGNIDLFAVDGATGNRFLNLGLGNGTFAAGGPTSFVGLSSFTLIDADRDGDVDIYGSFGDGTSPAATADQLMILD